MTSGVRERVHVGDVLIVGAGAAGVTTALRCDSAGLSGVVIEASAIGACQSQHSHGYLHDGSIYPDASPSFCEALRDGREQWLGMLDQASVEPITKVGNIGFTNPLTRAALEERWASVGLRPNLVAKAPSGFSSAGADWFETQEPAYDFTNYWAYAASATDAVRFVRGEVLAAHVVGRRVESVSAEIDGRRFDLTAGVYIFTAGAGNLPLIRRAFGVNGRLVVRPSFMLVVDAQDLPREAVILPGTENRGLFLVPRVRADDRVAWLAGDFMSLRGASTSTFDEWSWRRGMITLLRRLTGVIDRPGVRLGSYSAPKAELRADVRYLGAHHIEDYGVVNLVVATPTKLTLAPVLAAEAAGRVLELLRGTPSLPSTFDAARWPAPPVGAEHWLDVALVPVKEALERPRRVERSSAARWTIDQ